MVEFIYLRNYLNTKYQYQNKKISMNNTIKFWFVSKIPQCLFAAYIFTHIFCKSNDFHPIDGFHPIMEYLPNNKTLWLILLCIWLSICLIIPIRIAVFSYKNTDEILSYSFFFHNSNVDRFGFRLSYTCGIWITYTIALIFLPFHLLIWLSILIF